MRTVSSLCIFLFLAALSWRRTAGTCVLESDFGFTLNCQFKKSSMFRVRNLGGVKGYVGLGFSVGDELGFRQSLSNTEGNKRRSAVARSTGLTAIPDASLNTVGKSHEVGRMYPGYSRPKSTQLTTVPPFRPIPPADPQKNSIIAVQTNDTVRRYSAATVPQFQALPASIVKVHGAPKAPQNFRASLQQATDYFQTQSSYSNAQTSTKLAHRTPTHISSGPQVIQVVPAASDRSSVSSGKQPLPTAIPVANALPQEKPKTEATLVLTPDAIKSLSAASNLSEETIAAAIALRKQQLLAQMKPKITTTTTTTSRPVTEHLVKYPLSGLSKVMNAPREYYPVGYDKNFDDNFVSRVELPDTTFYCGEQKHFPGLYADEDLGCMVFHVCAFTDDGLIMKSFLCPESTLFDQSILKCNWWFYVDCKASKKLYDSNIPISKSYQLMKALSFFSGYNKQR